jgi:D-alanyl-D-alanine carboxypeptidase
MASPAAALAEKFEAIAASFVKENRLPGAAVGIVHEGGLAWSGGVGFADRATRRASDARTLYRVASITKTVTATAVMQLRDEGALALDDPAVTYLPELAVARSSLGAIESLTIRRMLSHESGLQSEPPGTDWAGVLYEADPARTLLRAAEIETRVPVHSQWKYSNLAYQLLGEIVARASGTTYAKYIRARILRPLGMASTSLSPVPARLRTRCATGYEPRFVSDELAVAPEDRNIFGAEGGLWSCVDDLARWLSCQLADDPKIVARSTLDEMHKPRYLVDEAWTRATAVGWSALRRDDVVWIGHSGGYYGFVTHVCFEPKEKIGAIALVNGMGEALELALRLGAVARDAVREAAPTIAVPDPMPEAWRSLPGLYLGEHFDTVLRVEWLDGKLTVLDPGSPAWKLTLAPTDEQDVFLIEPGARESGELARFEREPGSDARVAALFLAVARLRRLEPV